MVVVFDKVMDASLETYEDESFDCLSLESVGGGGFDNDQKKREEISQSFVLFVLIVVVAVSQKFPRNKLTWK